MIGPWWSSLFMSEGSADKAKSRSSNVQICQVKSVECEGKKGIGSQYPFTSFPSQRQHITCEYPGIHLSRGGKSPYLDPLHWEINEKICICIYMWYIKGYKYNSWIYNLYFKFIFLYLWFNSQLSFFIWRVRLPPALKNLWFYLPCANLYLFSDH